MDRRTVSSLAARVPASVAVFGHHVSYLEQSLNRYMIQTWTARRSNQSILKETSPGCSLEGLMLKLKLQYFGHLMRRTNSLEKTLMLGNIEGRRRRGRQKMRWLDSVTDSVEPEQTSGDSGGQGSLVCCSPWGHRESDTT